MPFALRSLTVFKVFRFLLALATPVVLVGALQSQSTAGFVASALAHFTGYMLPLMAVVFFTVASAMGILFILMLEVHASDHIHRDGYSESGLAKFIAWAGHTARNSIPWLFGLSFIAGNFLILFIMGVCFFTCP